MAKNPEKKASKAQEAQEQAKPAVEPQAPSTPSEPASEPGNDVSGDSNPPAPSDGAPEGAGSNDAVQEKPVPAGKLKVEKAHADWEEKASAEVDALGGVDNLSPAKKRELTGSHPHGFHREKPKSPPAQPGLHQPTKPSKHEG